jgi:hypothetical protein
MNTDLTKPRPKPKPRTPYQALDEPFAAGTYVSVKGAKPADSCCGTILRRATGTIVENDTGGYRVEHWGSRIRDALNYYMVAADNGDVVMVHESAILPMSEGHSRSLV